jgi:hypothetical protein
MPCLPEPGYTEPITAARNWIRSGSMMDIAARSPPTPSISLSDQDLISAIKPAP